ncbi:MAG: 3-hydroxyacyl-CoA dehydrogenase family protein [Bryobacteraceae bacterium]
MSRPSFESAAVIGTGMMGPGIAMTLALGGLRATILGRTIASAAEGLEKARRQLAVLSDNDLITQLQASEAAERIGASAEFETNVAAAGIVIESAPENMEFKQDLFARMDSIAGPSTVLASNTSGLSITAVASRCRHPERVLTTHFWNPPHLMPLVEVIRGEKTDPGIATRVAALLKHCGKTPVLVKRDTPGQLGNRLQGALIREAIHIVQEGIADAEDVDLAAKCGFGIRLPVYGIFEHQDIVGLDMVLSISDYVSKDLCSKPEAPRLLKEKVARGELGAKTGRGFYDWSKKDADAVRARRDRFVLAVLKGAY